MNKPNVLPEHEIVEDDGSFSDEERDALVLPKQKILDNYLRMGQRIACASCGGTSGLSVNIPMSIGACDEKGAKYKVRIAKKGKLKGKQTILLPEKVYLCQNCVHG